MPSPTPNGSELVALLGRPHDDGAVQHALDTWGHRRQPELDTEDEQVLADWLPINELGLEFGFEDTAYLQALPEDQWWQAGITLSQLYFYGDTPAMQQFPGALPFGLTFSDDRSTARAKLAAHEGTRRSHLRDYWRLPDCHLTLAYEAASGLLESVFCRVLPEPWPALDQPEPPLTPEDFTALFGRRWSSAQVRETLQRYGYEEVLPEVRNDRSANFSERCGLKVEFAAGARLQAADPKFPKALAVAAAVYYAERFLDARGWTGPLPFGLQFDDTQEQMVAKVGTPPSEQGDQPLSGVAVWHFEHTSLIVIYSNLENRLLRITWAAKGFVSED